MKRDDITEIAARSLGSENSYAVYTTHFDSTLLNPIPRELARKKWNITGEEFTGTDVWHCHESTFLLDNGAPIAGTLKFIYPSDSPNIVESKSMKLYLNSFDMCKMGKSIEQAIDNYETQIAEDLQRIVGSDVLVHFFTTEEYNSTQKASIDGVDLFKELDLENIKIDDYQAQENHIRVDDTTTHQKIFTNILRSRCRHTKQKDTGSAYIDATGRTIVLESLFKHITSLREVNEFHEFCAEYLFTTIQSITNGELLIALLYSRRGSLDINPVRTNKAVPDWACDPTILLEKTQNQ